MTRSERFNGRMVSYDTLLDSFEDPTKAQVFSDKGLGVERMLDEIEGPDPELEDEKPKALDENEYHRKAEAARKRLERAGLGYLVPVMKLIIKNGKNRKESIWEIAQRKAGFGIARKCCILHTSKNC